MTIDRTLPRRTPPSQGVSERIQDPFSLLVEGVTEYAMYMLDRHGFVRTWNPGAQRVKGYAAADVVGQHVSIFYRPDDAAAEVPTQDLEIAATQGSFAGEGWPVRKDGSAF
jgi:PAS domain S-box-containing protein